MIYAESAAGATGAIIVSSDRHDKRAKIWDFGHSWQIQYCINGARKNGFCEYRDVLDYLTAKGW